MKPSAKKVLAHLERANGWVPLWELMSPSIGGTSADRRTRELKAAGYRIEWRYSNRPGSRETYYRLVREPVQLEMEMAM